MAAAEKSSFVLRHEIRPAVEMLSDEERGRLLLALLRYSEFGELPDFSGALGMAFVFIRGSLDRDAAAWSDKVKKRSEAGRLGGLAKVANASIAKQSETELANLAVPVPDPVPVPDRVPDLVPDPIPDPTPAAGRLPDGGEGFEVFWREYPKRVGRKDAEIAFSRAGVSLDVLLPAIEEQKKSEQWRRDGGRYIPAPAKWLSERRWEDELPKASDRYRIPAPEEYYLGVEGTV